MRRREFITLIGGAAAAWPLAARAQQPALPVIGVPRGHAAPSSAHPSSAFREGLSDGRLCREPERKRSNTAGRRRTPIGCRALATGLVRPRVAVIVATGRQRFGVAAKAATRTIPIVFGGSGPTPSKLGLVASLSRPGGNVTGVTSLNHRGGAEAAGADA